MLMGLSTRFGLNNEDKVFVGKVARSRPWLKQQSFDVMYVAMVLSAMT